MNWERQHSFWPHLIQSNFGISPSAVSGRDYRQDWYRNQVTSPFAQSMRTCLYDLQGGQSLLLQPRTYRGQHTHHVAAVQSGSSPEIPALRITGDVTELNVDIGRRLLYSPLPARNRHCRRIELLTQFKLAHAQAAAKSNEARCPSDIRVFLTHSREKLGGFVDLRGMTIWPIVLFEIK